MVRGIATSAWLTRRGLVTFLLTVVCLIVIRLVQVSYHEDPRFFGHSVSAIKNENDRHSWYHDILLKIQQGQQEEEHKEEQADEAASGQNETDVSTHNDDAADELPKEALGYRILESISSPDKKYWKLDLLGMKGYNPNLIPHPTDQNSWVLVLQRDQYDAMPFITLEEMTCNATFVDGHLKCSDALQPIDVKPSPEGVCNGDIESYKVLRGPRDARMFYGPQKPYLIFGSQSGYVCLGLWIRDIRQLLQVFSNNRTSINKHFEQLTELQRPSNSHPVEKNYFLFWDSKNVMHAHYDIYPRRAFAQMHDNGTGIKDLAPINTGEETCLKKLMPEPTPQNENIHQATNSLRITLCSRYDQNCVPNDSNTYIMHIFQHKLYYGFHANYRPYVFLFQQSAPFAVHAVGQKPFWINGRARLTPQSDVPVYNEHPDWMPSDHTEFFYITSMSWKNHGQQYHGYIDDTIFLAFGIEDAHGGVMDILAKDLLQDLAYC